MMGAPGYFGATGGVLEVAYHGTSGNSDTNNFGSHSSTIDFGGAGRRLAVIAIGFSGGTGNTGTIGSVSVGGVSATRLERSSSSSDHVSRAEIWVAEITEAGNHSVSINISGDAKMMQVAYYSVRNHREIYGTYGNRSSGSGSMNNSQPQPKNSAVIVVGAATRNNTTTRPETSLNGVNQDMSNGRDVSTAPQGGRYRAGHRFFDEDSGNHSAGHTLDTSHEHSVAIARFE